VTKARLVARIALVAVLCISVQAEGRAGYALLGWFGLPLPVAVDGYVMLAVMGKRDVYPALGVFFAAVCGGLVEIAITEEGYTRGDVWAAAVMAAVLTLVIWRLHRIEHGMDAAQALREQEERDRQHEEDEAQLQAEERRAQIAAITVQPIETPPAVTPISPRMRAKKPVAKKPEPEKRKAPSQEAAREILLGLDGLEQVSNAELGRQHGGSDVWWGQRKKALAAELDAMSTEAAETHADRSA
jgi:hypothetical protein